MPSILIVLRKLSGSSRAQGQMKWKLCKFYKELPNSWTCWLMVLCFLSISHRTFLLYFCDSINSPEASLFYSHYIYWKFQYHRQIYLSSAQPIWSYVNPSCPPLPHIALPELCTAHIESCKSDTPPPPSPLSWGRFFCGILADKIKIIKLKCYLKKTSYHGWANIGKLLSFFFYLGASTMNHFRSSHQAEEGKAHVCPTKITW